MYSDKSYQLTREEYNYLLPVLRKKLLNKRDIEKYYFSGSFEDLEDMLNRLKGLYNTFESIESIIFYKCFKYGNLNPFREKLKSHDKQTL